MGVRHLILCPAYRQLPGLYPAHLLLDIGSIDGLLIPDELFHVAEEPCEPTLYIVDFGGLADDFTWVQSPIDSFHSLSVDYAAVGLFQVKSILQPFVFGSLSSIVEPGNQLRNFHWLHHRIVVSFYLELGIVDVLLQQFPRGSAG